MKVNTCILVLVVVFCRLALIHGYGFFAHKLIAKLAWYHLNPAVKEAIKSIMPHGKSIGSMASWPDTVKHRPGYEWTRSLHFAGLRDHPPYFCQTQVWCPVSDLNVVSAALNYTVSFLTSYDYYDLAFALHFLMDFHMPLHRTQSYYENSLALTL